MKISEAVQLFRDKASVLPKTGRAIEFGQVADFLALAEKSKPLLEEIRTYLLGMPVKNSGSDELVRRIEALLAKYGKEG